LGERERAEAETSGRERVTSGESGGMHRGSHR
jgi:hypothetical protein